MRAEDFERMVVVGVAELAAALGIDRRKLRRQLEADGVRLGRLGRVWVVNRVLLRKTMPEFYDGVVECLAQR